MSAIQVNQTIACEGLACPMPVLLTKKAIEMLGAGEVLQVRATDKGSIADLQSWAKRMGHEYIGLKEEGETLCHYIRKGDATEMLEPASFPHRMSIEEIKHKLAKQEKLNIIDVREPAEYVFGHIPGSVSIPLGELEQRLDELDPHEEYAVICRSGNRSDIACHMLAEQGFQVKNVLPGMLAWTDVVEKG